MGLLVRFKLVADRLRAQETRWEKLKATLREMSKPDVQPRYLAVDALAEMDRLEKGTNDDSATRV